MSKSICIILNPAAKGEQAQKIILGIKAYFPQADLKMTQKAGDAQIFAADAAVQGTPLIVAAGGDGTVNEVVNGMSGSRSALGILPVGSMNVFAMELGISMDIKNAAKVILRGKKKKIDLAWANDRCFVQLAGVGLDAQVVQKTSSQSKKVFGPLSYLLTFLQMADYKPPKLTIAAPRRNDMKGAFVLVGNGRFYGGPFKLFPEGKMNDGKLDVCVFQKVGYLDILRHMQGSLLGTHVKCDDVVYFQTEKLQVISQDCVPYEVDGELCGETPVEFTVQKHGLTVMTP